MRTCAGNFHVKNKTKRRCKQSVESAGMACEGRARNRMLRKRWIVRNPGVGEDDITQFILARPFNTSWPLFMALLEKTHTFFGGGGGWCV